MINRKNLEDRLVNYSLLIYKLSKEASFDYFIDNLLKQIIRSSTSAALNYADAQNAESRKDFIHKIGVVLKELKESDVNLKILTGTGKLKKTSVIDEATQESYQLVSIFYRMSQTAKKNYHASKNNKQ